MGKGDRLKKEEEEEEEETKKKPRKERRNTRRVPSKGIFEAVPIDLNVQTNWN